MEGDIGTVGMAASLSDWFGALAMAVSAGGTIYAWLTFRSKANTEQIEQLAKDVAGQERRIGAIESEMKHLPAKEDVNELKIALVEMKGSIGIFGESLGGVKRAIDRIENFLSKSGK